MITNDRQFKISRSQLSKIRESIELFNIEDTAKRVGSIILAKAELEALKSEAEIISNQLREYEALKSGAITILKAENLDELPTLLIRARIAKGLSQRQLAEMLNLREQQIQRYESEEYASASLRRLSEVADALKLNISEVAEIARELPSHIKKQDETLDWNLFPVKEMYKRNWFEGFTEDLTSALNSAESLVEEFITNAIQKPVMTFHRKKIRSGSILDPYALMAWECRVLTLARGTCEKPKYNPDLISDAWLKELIKDSYYPDGPLRAQKRLEEAGISLIVEPHLSHTHLDGAAFMHEGQPVIGLTLRYDRTDNFWFVLIHELVHIKKHLSTGDVESIFDNLDDEPDEIERETDKVSSQIMIPDEIWETALARYTRTVESVCSLADELHISPAIIAGRIRNEANNYVIFKDLIGQGEIRKLFPNVNFG